MLPKSTAEILVHAFITSRLGNGYALLNGISEQHIHKLQIVQNSAARVLTNTRKFDHITPVRRELHWLPIRKRIQYKTALLTWKASNNMAPSYTCDFSLHIFPHALSSFIWQMFTWNSKNILYFLRWSRILRCCTRTVEFTAFASSSDKLSLYIQNRTQDFFLYLMLLIKANWLPFFLICLLYNVIRPMYVMLLCFYVWIVV